MKDHKTTYTIKSIYKKSTCEEQDWVNTLSTGDNVLVKVCNVYRWGEFTIELTDREHDELLEKEEVKLDDYDHELIEMWDGGCDFWIDIIDEDDYSVEQLDEINVLLYKWKNKGSEYEAADDDDDDDDDDYSNEKMEQNGWIENDCHIILGKCELTPLINK